MSRTVTGPASSHPWFAPRAGDHKPLIFAHQGGAGLWPAHTMLAFGNATRMGVDVLDMDLRLTRDGAMVLIHDETVDRTTDGTGAVRDLTLAQVRRLDAGFRFTLDGGQTFPFRGTGLTVPLLEEVLEAFPDRRLGVEIKGPPEDARRLGALIGARRAQDRLLVSGFSEETMDAFRRACPEAASSATEREVRIFSVLSRLHLTWLVRPRYHSLQVPETSGGRLVLSPGFVAAARRSGLAVQPWTIDTPEALRRMQDLGVDGVNTNFPDRLLPLFAPAAGAASGP